MDREPLIDPNYVMRLQIEEGGPVYLSRIRGTNAYFYRRLPNGTIELLVRPSDHPVYLGDPETCFSPNHAPF